MLDTIGSNNGENITLLSRNSIDWEWHVHNDMNEFHTIATERCHVENNFIVCAIHNLFRVGNRDE